MTANIWDDYVALPETQFFIKWWWVYGLVFVAVILGLVVRRP